MKNEQEKVYNFKQRIISGAVALAIGFGSYLALKPSNAYAEGNGHKFGIYYDMDFDYEFNTYVVEDNDLTASNVSTKLVNYFLRKKEVPKEDREIFKENPNASCRFWPVVVYLYTTNQEGKKVRNYHTRPGEKIKFPKTYEEMKELNAELKRSGWFANYCQQHNIYKKPKKVFIDKETARQMVFDAMSYMSPDEYICVDDDTLNAYLKTIGGKQYKYVFKDGAKLTKFQKWLFYEWIPTPEEIKESNKGKGSSKLVRLVDEKKVTSEDLTPEETHKILKKVNKNFVA